MARVQVIWQAGQTINNEVPVYVPPDADIACVLPIGFIRLDNDDAAGHLFETPRSYDAVAAGITLSKAGATNAENNQRCRENSTELIGLQDWVRLMKSIAEGVILAMKNRSFQERISESVFFNKPRRV